MLKSLFFSKGIAMDRFVGFQDLGAKDDFSTTKLENLLVKKGRASLSFLDFATYSLQLLSLNQFFSFHRNA